MTVHTEGAATARVKPRWNLAGLRVHLVGIGGSGMSGAAAMLLELGAKVSGSDRDSFDGLGALVERGAVISVGHDAGLLDPTSDLVVTSAAVPDDNPELCAARTAGIPIMKYAELIGTLTEHYPKSTAVAGTHGKSTTTALCTWFCREAGLRPTFLFGARSPQLGGGSGVERGELFLVEACEFDRSFLHLHPSSAAILNIEPDHLDCYRDLEDIVDAFTQFAQRVASDGVLVCPHDDSLALRAASGGRARVETFGLGRQADWRAVNVVEERGCFGFDVTYQGKRFPRTRLDIPGVHNVCNALAAMALAYHAGVDGAAMSDALPRFQGVHRRLTCRGQGNGITIVDDYAHHPTEVRVTIEAARKRYTPRRMWVVFQPHQNTRTRFFLDEFADSFSLADEVIVSDVYGARETGQGASNGRSWCGGAALVSRMGRHGVKATYRSTLSAAADHVIRHAADGDLVMTMGAGDIWKVADELVARFCRPRGG